MAYSALSQYEKAIGYYEHALVIAQEFKNRRVEARSLNNLGIAYRELSQYEKAIGYFEQALAIFREAKDRGGESSALNNLGNAYGNLSQNEKEIEYFEQALAIARETKDRNSEGRALGSLGMAYRSLDQDKSIGYFERALTVFREIKDRNGEGRALGNLGNAYRHLGQDEKAIGHLDQALAIAREVKNRDGEGRVLLSLGIAYFTLNQNEKAIRYYQQALAIGREIKTRDLEFGTLYRLMGFWSSQNPRLAIFYGKQAVNTVQSIRFDIRGLGLDLQQSFSKHNETPYHVLAELLIAQGRLAEAEQVLGLLKQHEYFEYIRRDASEASALNRRADLTAEEADWEKRYSQIGGGLFMIGTERGELLAKRTLTPEQTQRLAALEQDLAVGNQAFEKFLGELSTHFNATPEGTNAKVEQLREAQGMMEELRELPRGTVVIHTVVGADKYYAILRTPDTQKAYEYPIKAADLNRKVLEFRQVARDPKLDPRPQAQELYNILIGPMAKDLRQAKARTLMFSLDGILRYLPLAALYDGKRYLIEQYRVSVITLASHMALKDKPDATWKAAGFGVTKAFEGSAALPSVSSELSGIISSSPGDRGVLAGEIKLDGQFTQQAMRQTLLKRYQVVHIASHFRFVPGNETQSFLLLGDGAHLSLAELKTSANLFGGVQLLTLSACNTGMGDGAEVEGFGALAQRQGAKSVIASLWPVADASTSRLMQEFYRIRQSSPTKTKLEALQEAQLELLRGVVKAEPAAPDRELIHEPEAGVPKPQAPPFPYNAKAPFSHPYYWAPFFLMGNWL